MGNNLGRVDSFAGNSGIGNLYRVIQHGQDLGVVAPRDPKDPKQGWNCIVPTDPPVPGRRIVTDALVESAKRNPKGAKYGNKASRGWRRADETAKTLYGAGLDAFVADLAKNLKIKSTGPGCRTGMTALEAIAEQLFLSKPVSAWGRIKREPPGADAALSADDNLVGEIAELDERLGRGVSNADLMAAAISLVAMVDRGELEAGQVKAYLDETVFDYADQKATLQMTARAMGEMRANVLLEGWGDAYYTLVRQYAKEKGWNDPELRAKYEAMVAAADKIRAKRMPLVEELGLKCIPAGTGTGEGGVLRELKTQLGNGARAAGQSRHWYGAYVGFARKDSFAEAEVREFAQAAAALGKSLGKRGWKGVGELSVTNGFSDGFKKNAEDYLRVLSQGAELSARLGREEEVRTALREALSGVPRGKNGLCKAGVYTLSFSIGVDASLGIGPDVVGKTAVSAGLKVGVSVTVAINEDGSASVSDDIKIGGTAGVSHESAVAKASAEVSADLGFKKAKVYKDIDAMCNDTSQAILTAVTGRGIKAVFENLFHWGSVNAESRAIAKRIDNYAMRSLMTRSGLMDETDRYLTPMKYNPVANEEKSDTGALEAKASVSAGSDKATFLSKTGLKASASAGLTGTKVDDIRYKSHFAQARAGNLKVDENDKARYDRALKATRKGKREDQLLARLDELRRELDDFSRVAAVQKRKTDRVFVAGSDAEYAVRDHFKPGRERKYEDYLNARNAGRLSGRTRVRHFFQSNVRRTLFLADLAHEAAYCEAELRKIHRNGRLPDQARRAIEVIEGGIYDNPEVHLNGSLAEQVLYEKETSSLYKTSSTVSSEVKLNIPTLNRSVGLGVKVTSSSLSKANAPKGRPKRPWDASDTVTFSLDLTGLGKGLGTGLGTGLGVRPGGRKGLNANAAFKLVANDIVQRAVQRMLNDYARDNASTGVELLERQGKADAAKLLKNVVPDEGVFGAKSSQTLTLQFVKVQENGKALLRLKEISVDTNSSRSVDVNLSTGTGISAKLSGSRSSSENEWYRIGANSLNGVMFHYGFMGLGAQPLKWADFLQRQKPAVAELAKNAGQPQYGVGKDCPRGGIKPRTGLMGELDGVQRQMWAHGDRAQYDAFVRAWAELGESAKGDAKKRGDALTALLVTIDNFYKETNKWWVRKAMPRIEKGL